MFRSCLFGLSVVFLSLFSVKKGVGQFSISGTVTDSLTEQTINAASISVKGPVNSGAYSDNSGHFKINRLPKGHYILEVRYLGYESVKKAIDLDDDLRNINIPLKEIGLFIKPIEIQGTRAGENDPFTKTNISAEELSQKNMGQDLPYLLKNQPSLITTSDAGAGVGYTTMWIRGSDNARINVTINGIPVNDAESSGAFFVDIPDIASSTNSIQIQRGVGTSTNGSGAFGATVNLSTNTFHADPYGKVSASYGSFNTQKYTVKAGSGLLNDHFTIDARLSSITSDGYIDRASSNLKSYYLSTAYFNKKTALRFNIFSGKEETYQAWNGVPEDSLKAGNRTFNGVGRMPDGKFYDNQIDHYQQTYYQLFWNQEINNQWHFNLAAFLTRGKGYYEEYKMDQPYENYGLKNPVIGKDTLTATDLIRDRWLDNYYYGNIFSVTYQGEKLNATLGGGWSKYDGKHYGDVIWAQHAIDKDHRYYYNTAYKRDFNIYWKGSKTITEGLSAFLDLQYKHVTYDIYGFTEHPDVLRSNVYNFFNPKAGLNYLFRDGSKLYASYAIAHKTPNRKDFENNIKDIPDPEVLYDLEVGYHKKGNHYNLHTNIYYMDYQNQLVLTGQINSYGVYTRTNVPKSYRLGLEINGSVDFAEIFTFDANLSLSRNRIQNFTAYFDDYDNGGQKATTYEEVPISFSAPVVGGGTLTAIPLKHFEVELSGKYIGRRFIDNTGNEDRSLNAYFINGLAFYYTLLPKGVKNIDLSLKINNLFNAKYVSNGFTFAYYQNGNLHSSNSYFPQAGINFLLGVNINL